MDGFVDLLTEAFSESSVPSFSMGDLDFRNLSNDEKSDEEEAENPKAETDEPQLQETSAEGAALFEGPTADAMNVDEKADDEQTDEENDEEDFRGVSFGGKTPEDDDGSSSDGEEEEKVFCSGEDEEEEAESPADEGAALMSICSSDVLDLKRDNYGIADDEDTEILEDSDARQVSDKLQEVVDSDEEEDGGGDEKVVESDESEEDEEEEDEEREEDSSDSDYEGVNIEDENFLSEDRGKPFAADPADSGLEFPSISFQNLQDLITEVDGEAHKEKISNFTGEEHQEAGESLADYSSDFSSGEYGRKSSSAQSNLPRPIEEESLERAVTDSLWIQRSEEADCGNEAEFLFSRDIEMNAGKKMSLDEPAREAENRRSGHLLSATRSDDEEKKSDSDSYSSSDDEEPLRRSSPVFSDQSRNHYLKDQAKMETNKFHDSSCGDDRNTGDDRYDLAKFLSSGLPMLETNNFLSEYLQTAEDTDGTKSSSRINQRPEDEDISCYSVVQGEDKTPASPFTQGSIEDSFFFQSKPNNFTDDGQEDEDEEDEEEDDDEYKERSSFEQMKHRIEAFKKFYDNSDDENEREERKTKVQFCADLLSQVNYYETDSSETDSISSSSDREKEPSPEEPSDEPRETEEDLDVKPACDGPVTQQYQSQADRISKEICAETRKPLSALKLIVTLGVLTATGLMMFSLTTNQPEWLTQFFFF